MVCGRDRRNSSIQSGWSFFYCIKLIQRIELAKPDIILMDIGMPGLSKIEAVLLIKKAIS